MRATPKIPVLFVDKQSVYKLMEDVDAWDEDRDALNWRGKVPAIYHPPCRTWSRLRKFSKAPLSERRLAIWSIEQVRRWGGVVEHPAESSLWPFLGLPLPDQGEDVYGGWTLQVCQHWWGHRAEKKTWLYIVGASTILPMPVNWGPPTHVVDNPRKGNEPRKPWLTKRERSATPRPFAEWLVNLVKLINQNRIKT